MYVFPARLESNCGCGISHISAECCLRYKKPSVTMRRPESLFGSRKLGTNQEGSFSHVPVVFRVRTLSDSEEARPADRRGDSQLIRCGPPAADLNRTKSRSMTLHLARGLSARRHARPSSAKSSKERVGVKDGAYLTTDHEQKGVGTLEKRDYKRLFHVRRSRVLACVWLFAHVR